MIAIRVTVDNYNSLFRDSFLVAFADCVAYFKDFDIGVASELEGAFMHLNVYLFDRDQKTRDANLRKAYYHVVRATLDCRKLIWIDINLKLKKYCNDKYIRERCTKIPEYEFLSRCNLFFNKSDEVRLKELKNLGRDPDLTISDYSELVEMGIDLLNTIDTEILSESEQKKFHIFVKKIIREFSITIIAAIIVFVASIGYLLIS